MDPDRPGSTRNRPGIDLESTWNRPGINSESTRNWLGIDLESTRNRLGIDPESTWYRPGIDSESTRNRSGTDPEPTQTFSHHVPDFVTPCTKACHTLFHTMSHLVPKGPGRTIRGSDRSEQKAGWSPAVLRVINKKNFLDLWHWVSWEFWRRKPSSDSRMNFCK